MKYINEITELCLKEFGVGLDAIRNSISRSEGIVNCRAAMSHLLHTYAQMSYPEMAMRFSKCRDAHATWHSAKARWPRLDEEVRNRLDSQVKTLVGQNAVRTPAFTPPPEVYGLSKSEMWVRIRELEARNTLLMGDNDRLRLELANQRSMNSMRLSA